MIPVRRADRIRFSQYFLKLVFCVADWLSWRAISSMMLYAHLPNLPCSLVTKGMKVMLLDEGMCLYFAFLSSSLVRMARSLSS